MKELQNIFKSSLGEISKGSFKPEDQKSTLKNTKILYKSREKVIKLFDDFFSMISEGKYKTKHGEGLKILTPKQIPQRLAIALAEVKAGNTSENLLNEITQIIYSFYRAKEKAKKSYNNIMNSIKV